MWVIFRHPQQHPRTLPVPALSSVAATVVPWCFPRARHLPKQRRALLQRCDLEGWGIYQGRGTVSVATQGKFYVGIFRKTIWWVFPTIGVLQNGWFRMENPIINGWFGGTAIFGNTQNMQHHDIEVIIIDEFGMLPQPRLPVTTRIVTLLGSGSRTKPSLATAGGWGSILYSYINIHMGYGYDSSKQNNNFKQLYNVTENILKSCAVCLYSIQCPV